MFTVDSQDNSVTVDDSIFHAIPIFKKLIDKHGIDVLSAIWWICDYRSPSNVNGKARDIIVEEVKHIFNITDEVIKSDLFKEGLNQYDKYFEYSRAKQYKAINRTISNNIKLAELIDRKLSNTISEYIDSEEELKESDKVEVDILLESQNKINKYFDKAVELLSKVENLASEADEERKKKLRGSGIEIPDSALPEKSL